MPKRRRRRSTGTKTVQPNPYEEYEMLKHRAQSDRIHKSLQGHLAPDRRQVVEKLNKRRKEHET